MKSNLKKIIPFFILFLSPLYLIQSYYDRNNLEKIEIQTKKNDKLFIKGKNLFIKNCTGCHYIGMDKIATAPALGGITKLRKKEWLYNYTRNSFEMYEKGDSIAKKIREEGWGVMISFPELTNSDLDAIYYFVEKNHEALEKDKIRKK